MYVAALYQNSNLDTAFLIPLDVNIILDRKQIVEGWFKLHKNSGLLLEIRNSKSGIHLGFFNFFKDNGEYVMAETLLLPLGISQRESLTERKGRSS